LIDCAATEAAEEFEFFFFGYSMRIAPAPVLTTIAAEGQLQLLGLGDTESDAVEAG
jgi:hypothetical protein